MSNWSGKYVIGLTGNIATGKSVVRKMLEHLGAYGIDADALVHRATAKGAPGYQAVIDTFGKWIVDKNGEINRTKLGQLVFNDADALEQLEQIVHPLVGQAVDMLVKRSKQSVIVIEAIKLLEGQFAAACDTVWVADVPENIQLTRLMSKRNMSEADARLRIRTQNPQADKVAAANVVIRNTGSFEDLWKEVSEAWMRFNSTSDTTPIIVQKKAKTGNFSVQRGRPRDSQAIAEMTSRLSGTPMTSDNVMEAFGEKAFLLLKLDDETVGIAGWQVENLVTRTTDLYINADISLEDGLKALVEEIEEASKDLQSEASLLFLTATLAKEEAAWKSLGYERSTPHTLGSQAWKESAEEVMKEGQVLFFKQLRTDRVLRPI